MIDRFDAVTRVVHWTTTILTAVLLGTGTILYVGQLSAIVGRRALLASIHVWSGILLFVPLLAAMALPRVGRHLRADVRELGQWTRNDRRWLRRRTRVVPTGKFNGGQKLAAAAFAGLLAMQLVTGALMHWNQPFTDDWRTGATFVHDWVYLALVVLTVGHIHRALREPDLLRAMTSGRVTRSWAARERPGWSSSVPDEKVASR